MKTTFIPTDTYDALTNGLVADMANLMPEVDGGTAHKVAEVLSRYGLFPEDMVKQIVADMRTGSDQQVVTGLPTAVMDTNFKHTHHA